MKTIKRVLVVYFLLYPVFCFAPPIVEQVRIQYLKELALVKQKQEKINTILLAIRTIESGGNYQVMGATKDFGAYQFIPSTWKHLCKKYFGKQLDITISENQDNVASKWVEELIDKGYNELQIASVWNCGSPKWEGKVGTNSAGVKYDVPNHVKKFKRAYENIQKTTNYYV